MSSAIEPQQGEGTVWSQFLPVAAQSVLAFLLPWGLLSLWCERPSAGGQGAASMEREILSPFPLAEEAPQKE